MTDFQLDQNERIPARSPRPQRRLRRIVVLVVLIAFALIVWFAFSQGQQMGFSQVTPVIKADTTPFKERPDQPGGMEIPHQDKLIYEELQGKNAEQVPEKLLPPPEQPIEKPAGAAATIPVPAQNVAERPAPEIQPAEPKVEELKPIVAPEPKKAEPVKKETPKKAAAAPTPASSGKFRIQFASLPDKGQADKAAAAVKTKHADMLKGKTVAVRGAEIPGKGVYYRVQADGFADRNAAQDACAAFKAKGQSCIPVAP